MSKISKMVIAAAACAGIYGLGNSANAANLLDTFEGAAPSGYTRQLGTSTTLSSEHALGTTSAKITLGSVNSDYSTVSDVADAPIGKLKDVLASFQYYLDSANSTYTGSAPYILLGVDSNHDGVYDYATDSQIIQFSTSTPLATNTWTSQSLLTTDLVHVDTDSQRPGLGATEFNPSFGGGTLQSLIEHSDGGAGVWGDFDVVRVRVGAGFFNDTGSYTAFIDNLSAVNTPEPTTLGVVGAAAAGLLLCRRRAIA